MDKYCDIEKSYKTNVDNWLCNLYFSLSKKDSLANPYSVQLVLDEDTKNRHEKYLENTSKTSPAINVKTAEKAEKDASGGAYSKRLRSEQNIVEVPENDNTIRQEVNLSLVKMDAAKPVTMEKKKTLINAILETRSDDGGSDEDEKHEPSEKYHKLTKPKHYDEYTYHIPHVELKTSVDASQKLKYILNEALSDLGFHNVMSIEFWISLLILMLTMWIRAFMHTFGSWMLLKITGTPVTTFDPKMYFYALYDRCIDMALTCHFRTGT